MTPKFNNCPRNAWIVIIFGMFVESWFVKYILKGIWWQMKFCEIFWGEVKINTLKGGGYASKRETIILFPRCQIVKETSSCYKWKIIIPMFNCIFCQIYLFNTVIISSTLFSVYSNSFLTFICRRFPQREDNVMLKLKLFITV